LVFEGLAGITPKPPIKPLCCGSLNFPHKIDNLSKQLKEPNL